MADGVAGERDVGRGNDPLELTGHAEVDVLAGKTLAERPRLKPAPLRELRGATRIGADLAGDVRLALR